MGQYNLTDSERNYISLFRPLTLSGRNNEPIRAADRTIDFVRTFQKPPHHGSYATVSP